MTDRYGTAPSDEDLPRTVKRDKAARQAAIDQATQRSQPAYDPPSRSQGHYQAQSVRDDDAYPGDLPPVSVQRLDVPFFRLAWFLMKCVLAGIPALLLLFAVLWGLGQAMQKFVPWLVKLRILISFQ